MPIELIKQEINRFLASPEPEVLAIKGPWGIGKTYGWNRYLKEANEKHQIGLKRYSYVSLFGINSLAFLKYAIFESSIKTSQIGEKPSLNTIKTNATSIFEMLGKKSLSLFKGTGFGAEYTPAIDTLAFMFIKDSIICIDDLERRGDGLTLKDTLGLITFLKEQKSCKVVILFNNNTEGLDEYISLKEKVVDIELDFDLSSSECSEIAFFQTGTLSQAMKEFASKLDIRNIRVLKKIERLVIEGIPLIQEFEEEIRTQLLHSIFLYCWCSFSRNDSIPTLEYVISVGHSILRISNEDEKDEKKQQWNKYLIDYGYETTDEFDLEIAQVVLKGFYNKDSFLRAAATKNKEIVAQKEENSFNIAWDKYHESFKASQKEVVDAIYDGFKVGVMHISPANLNSTVTFFKEMGESKKANELIDYYIERRKDEKLLFDLNKYAFVEDVTDKDVKDKFLKQRIKDVGSRNFEEIIDSIAVTHRWDDGDELVLENASEKEYYDVFMKTEGKKLSQYIRLCLRFGSNVNDTDRHKIIHEKALNALLKIGKISLINKKRVSKYGIEIPD